MRRLALLMLALAAVPAIAARRPVRVGAALCVTQADGPLLALSPASRAAYLTAMAEAGWRVLRTDVTWSRVQPAPTAALDFTSYDALVAESAARGIALHGVLGDDRAAPDDPAAFATFAGEAARRWRGRIDAWEIWDEPNDPASWQPAPDPAAYTQLASAASRAIARGDRKARRVAGGLAPAIDLAATGRDYDFFTQATLAERRWFGKLHAAALHPYAYLQAAPEIESPPLGPSLTHQMRSFRDRQTESRASRLRLWVTALGWHTSPDGAAPPSATSVGELDQARYLVRGVVLALSQLAERVCWHGLLDGPDFATDAEDAFGLFRDPTAAGGVAAKPAFQAAKTLATLLGPLRFVKDLRVEAEMPPNGYAFAFQSAKLRRSVVVMWATDDGVVADFGVTGGIRVHRVEMDGAVADLGRPERLDLVLGRTPFYLVLGSF